MFKSKGQSGKPLASIPPYGYKKSENDKNVWVVDEEAAQVVKRIFKTHKKSYKNKRKTQKCGEVAPFSGMVYCADCGAKMYLCRSKSLTDEQEHLKCSTYAIDTSECSAHYIRTAVLRQLVLDELNTLLETVHANEGEFVNAVMEYASTAQSQ